MFLIFLATGPKPNRILFVSLVMQWATTGARVLNVFSQTAQTDPTTSPRHERSHKPVAKKTIDAIQQRLDQV